MSKKIFLFFNILLVGFSQLFATQSSCFENLGFSGDGRYFLFGQYGSELYSDYPFAELYFINVEHNVYYPGGVFRKTYSTHSLQRGEETKSALLSLLGEMSVQALRKKLGINHLLTGRQIYQVYEEKGEPKDFSHKELSFVDFDKGDRYRVLLRQSVNEADNKIESCFFINAQLLGNDGQVLKTITVGHPLYNRSNISNYRIAQIFVIPGQAGLLFVVERENKTSKGDIFYDYMVEVGKLR